MNVLMMNTIVPRLMLRRMILLRVARAPRICPSPPTFPARIWTLAIPARPSETCVGYGRGHDCLLPVVVIDPMPLLKGTHRGLRIRLHVLRRRVVDMSLRGNRWAHTRRRSTHRRRNPFQYRAIQPRAPATLTCEILQGLIAAVEGAIQQLRRDMLKESLHRHLHRHTVLLQIERQLLCLHRLENAPLFENLPHCHRLVAFQHRWVHTSTSCAPTPDDS